VLVVAGFSGDMLARHAHARLAFEPAGRGVVGGNPLDSAALAVEHRHLFGRVALPSHGPARGSALDRLVVFRTEREFERPERLGKPVPSTRPD
jgi:hypothetical protein